jgi:hypothetical protein
VPDPAPLRAAFGALLDAAADADRAVAPPPGEWTAGQVLAHVSVVTAATTAAVCAVAAGTNATLDNRAAQDAWTLRRVLARAGGPGGLAARLRGQGDALCALAAALGEEELDTPVPALLLSGGELVVDRPLALRDLVAGLAAAELPGHTAQLRALLPGAA